MRRRLREYKKEKRMWCRYVAGAMAFMMLAVSAPVTSAFGLENEEEEQATILTYKETDEGMVVDQLIPTEEAQASWEEGFQQAKAELEAEGYENITDASDENNMVYVGGEDYVVPVSYVEDEEKDTIPLELYNGGGGEYYLWKYIRANHSEKAPNSTENIWIRTMEKISLKKWKDTVHTAENTEIYMEPEFFDEDVNVKREDKIEDWLNMTSDALPATSGQSVKLQEIFDVTSMRIWDANSNDIPVSESNNVNPSIIGNTLIGYNAVKGGGTPTGGIAPAPYNTFYQSGTFIESNGLVSLRAAWKARLRFNAKVDVGQGALKFGLEGASATVGVDAKEGAFIQAYTDGAPNGLYKREYIKNGVNGYYDGTKEVEISYHYEDGIGGITTIKDVNSGTSVTGIRARASKKGKLQLIATANINLTEFNKGIYTVGKIGGEFVSFSYNNFHPELMSSKWYDSNGNELSKNSKILAGDKITVKTAVKNNSTEADQFGAHLKLSDDDSQVYTNGIDVTGSGLDGDGTAVTLTNQEQENTFVVTATRDITAGELALGVMMEDDFFHEKQYMQLHLGEQYRVTYDSNLSSLDPAVNADAVTVPEIATVPTGDSFTVGNVSAAQIDSTDGTIRYEFTGWNTQPDGSGDSYAAGASMTPTGATTLYAQWRNATLCPLTLDVSDNSVKDKAGTLIADASTAHDGYTYDPATGAVQIDERLFGGACNAPDGHVHTLTITGTKSDADGLVTIGTSGTSAAAYNVSVERVTAPGMVIQSNGGSVTFNGTNLLGGGTGLNGLELDVNGSSVTLADGSAVTAYTKASDGFALKDSGKTVKSLNLTMGYQNTQDVGMRVAGVDKSLPAGTAKIAFLDKKDGTWLTTSAENMKVQNADGSADYVSGATETSYKKTFELGADGVGNYTDVRLPSQLKQISLTVPTRVVFNIYTEGKDGADHGFIGPEYELKNTSYTAEDYYKGKEYGPKTYQPVDVGFGGITAREESQYKLADYKTADEGVLNETITDFNTKPLVCIQALGNGTKEGRVNLDESAGSASADWFKAAAATGDGESKAGISKIKLTVPKEYTGSDSKRWYQDVEAVSKEGHVYRGYHTMKLSFTLP